MPVKIQKIPPPNPVPFDVNIPQPFDDAGNLRWSVTIQNCTTPFSTFKVDSQNTNLIAPLPGELSPIGGWQVTNEVNIPSNVIYTQNGGTAGDPAGGAAGDPSGGAAGGAPPPDPNHNGTTFPFSSKRVNGQVNFTIIDEGGTTYTIGCLVTIT